ncbi:hypothetical protein EJB05_39097, partial [Eragrostis curvula]
MAPPPGIFPSTVRPSGGSMDPLFASAAWWPRLPGLPLPPTPLPPSSSALGRSEGAQPYAKDGMNSETSDWKAKRLPYTEDEDRRLVSAWLHNSNDPINGNCKKNEKYWTDVLADYNNAILGLLMVLAMGGIRWYLVVVICRSSLLVYLIIRLLSTR